MRALGGGGLGYHLGVWQRHTTSYQSGLRYRSVPYFPAPLPPHLPLSLCAGTETSAR